MHNDVGFPAQQQPAASPVVPVDQILAWEQRENLLMVHRCAFKLFYGYDGGFVLDRVVVEQF